MDIQNKLSIGELRRLADIGGSALKQRIPIQAENIFSAIIPFCPPISNGPLIGLAMSKYAQNETDQAISILRDQALVNDPRCSDSHAHLALILRSTGQASDSNLHLNAAVEFCTDDSLAELIKKIENRIFDAQS